MMKLPILTCAENLVYDHTDRQTDRRTNEDHDNSVTIRSNERIAR